MSHNETEDLLIINVRFELSVSQYNIWCDEYYKCGNRYYIQSSGNNHKIIIKTSFTF